VARQHFARHLRVTRLVRANQSEGGKPEEKQKTAKTNQQQTIRIRANAQIRSRRVVRVWHAIAMAMTSNGAVSGNVAPQK